MVGRQSDNERGKWGGGIGVCLGKGKGHCINRVRWG